MQDHKKDKILQIRCTSKTLQRFKIFVAKSNSKDYEEALNKLLNIADKKIGIESI